jgi:hypothetical protein
MVAVFAAAACSSPAAPAAPATPAPAAPTTSAGADHVDPVVAWNRTLIEIMGMTGAQPATVHPTRSLAIMHAAIYDAVNGIDGKHAAYKVDQKSGPASEEAAASSAAETTLLSLYPNQQALIEQRETAALADIPDGAPKDAGVAFGKDVATKELALRANDGSATTPPPFSAGTAAGDYQLTPPKLAPPQYTGWAAVTPFTLTKADQFRPPAPPALNSPEYAAAINEIKTLGVAQGSTRTDDQTQIATFWSGTIQNEWNQIAQTAAIAKGSSVADNARTFAQLNLALADGVIAFYDAKYTYKLWRPITAIQHADTDNNPTTEVVPDWTPQSATPPDPSYVGAHAVISGAAAKVLDQAFGTSTKFGVTSPTLPGVTRSFDNFDAAATEASVSRIYAGAHTRIDESAGDKLGASIGDEVLQTVAK